MLSLPFCESVHTWLLETYKWFYKLERAPRHEHRIWVIQAVFSKCYQTSGGFLGGSVGKESACDVGDPRAVASLPVLGSSPGGGHGNPLQNSCLENPMDRGAWRATVHGVAQSQACWRDWACMQAPNIWRSYWNPKHGLEMTVLLKANRIHFLRLLFPRKVAQLWK